MPGAPWRPASEAEAVSGTAVFLEWLAATRGVALAGPDALAGWRRRAPEAFAAAMAAFVGLHEHTRVREALLRGHGARVALVGERVWTRAELLSREPAPHRLDQAWAALTPADLPSLAARHLLELGTAPDDRVTWSGDPADPWPLGAWLVGAAVVVRPPVSGPGGG